MQSALSIFVTIYRTLADWRAIVARLDGFEAAIASATALEKSSESIDVVASEGGTAIDLRELTLRLPNGTPLVSADAFSLRGGERTLLTGPSGSGKSTLFRAIAGIWPFGSGSIAIPAGASVMMLPQRPYFPIGSLHGAIAYPGATETFSADRVREALTLVGLPKLAGRLEEESHWNRMLSLGEQQRLGLARALLHAPQYLFLDEATASLDEPSEAALYCLARAAANHHRLDRPPLDARGFHQRHVAMVRDGDGSRCSGGSVSDVSTASAAAGLAATSGARQRSGQHRARQHRHEQERPGQIAGNTSSGLIPAGG